MKKKFKKNKKRVVLGDTNCWPFVLQESIIWQGGNEVHANHFHRRCITEGAAGLVLECGGTFTSWTRCLPTFFFMEVRFISVVLIWKGHQKKKKKHESTNRPSSSPSGAYFSGPCTVTSLHLSVSSRYPIAICWWMKVACILIYETPSHPLT